MDLIALFQRKWEMHTKDTFIIRADRVICIPEDTDMADSFYSQEGKADRVMEGKKKMQMAIGVSRATNAANGDMQEGIV
eukprot:14437012-Ditylum_brightwellii.AAC.1